MCSLELVMNPESCGSKRFEAMSEKYRSKVLR